jgi:hypothetical protein
MMDHHAHAFTREKGRHALPDRDHDAGGFMASDDWRPGFRYGPESVEVGSAHTGCRDAYHDLSGAGRRVIEMLQFHLVIARYYDAPHVRPS